MSRKTLFVVTVLGGLVISGCTSLKSSRLLDGVDNDKNTTPPGLTYRLPAKQFTVKATFEITQCTPVDGRANLEGDLSAAVTESLIGDEAYTIDYKKLNAWTKVTNTEFQISEAGLLMGVNASIADKSGAVAANTVTTAANIVRAVALNGLPVPSVKIERTELQQQLEAINSNLRALSGRDDKKARLILNREIAETQKKIDELPGKVCDHVKKAVKAKSDAKTALENAKGADKDRAAALEVVRGTTVEIKALTELAETYEQLGDVAEKRRLLRRIQLDEKKKAEAEAKIKGLGESQTEKAAKALADATAALTIYELKDVVPRNDNTTETMKVTKEELTKVFGKELDVSRVQLPVVKITVAATNGQIGEADRTPTPKKIGIAYRIPVAAVVRVTSTASDSTEVLLLEKPTQVPQFGPIGTIDLNNEMFDDNLIELAFNGSTGTPSKLTFRAKSKAEEASASARDAADMYLKLQKDKRDDQIAANKTLLEQATAQVALEKQKTELGLAQVNAQAAAATIDATTQKALISAQLEILRDQQRLDAVRTGTATAAEVELEALGTQEKILAQRLKILKLEQEIAEQSAKGHMATGL